MRLVYDFGRGAARDRIMMMLDKVLQSVDSLREGAVEGLVQFLSIPSISTREEYRSETQRCARWLADQLEAAGLEAQVVPTGGHPVVMAKNAHRPGRPTLLIYGHYDVQPAEPLELWTSPPFEPSIRDGAIHARGAADDKGQVWAHVQAARAWQQHGGPPLNLVFLIEGEEEIGSENLEPFIRAHRDHLRCDVAAISDTSQFARGIPAITYGLRGLVYSEIILAAADHNLHSGVYGGAVPNPANILSALLASLHHEDGRINIKGFYDGVLPLTEVERQAWGDLPFDDGAFARELKLNELWGEDGYTTLERRWARPSLDINGLTSGYQGSGAQTIIPARASAKVSMRLVPQQDPQRIQEAFENTLRRRCPSTVSIEFMHHGLAAPVIVPLESEAMRLAAEAVQIGFGVRPAFTREGGSIPVVGLLKSALGVDTLLVGFGLPDDRIHSPNEKFDLEALHQGARTAAALYAKLAELKPAT